MWWKHEKNGLPHFPVWKWPNLATSSVDIFTVSAFRPGKRSVPVCVWGGDPLILLIVQSYSYLLRHVPLSSVGLARSKRGSDCSQIVWRKEEEINPYSVILKIVWSGDPLLLRIRDWKKEQVPCIEDYLIRPGDLLGIPRALAFPDRVSPPFSSYVLHSLFLDGWPCIWLHPHHFWNRPNITSSPDCWKCPLLFINYHSDHFVSWTCFIGSDFSSSLTRKKKRRKEDCWACNPIPLGP